MNQYGYPEEKSQAPPKKTREPWQFKDTVMLMSFLMIIALLGMLVWSGYDKQAIQEERNTYFKENALLKRQIRLAEDNNTDYFNAQLTSYKDQAVIYKKTLNDKEATIKECSELLSECRTNERSQIKAEQEFKSIQECEEKYEFMRTSLLNEYDIEADDFPKLINGLYYDGVIHVKVNKDIEQGLRTLCHESTHYFIDEDYKHFCE